MTLIAALLSIMLLLGLGGALVLTSMVETQSAAAFDRGAEAFHAADSAAEYVVQELESIADWSGVLSGSVRSPLADGLPGGIRVLDDGSTVRLDSLGNPWTPYLYSRADRMLPPGRIASAAYIVVWVSRSPAVPGALLLQAHAYVPGGGRRMIEVTVDRAVNGHVRTRSWQELRQ